MLFVTQWIWAIATMDLWALSQAGWTSQQQRYSKRLSRIWLQAFQTVDVRPKTTLRATNQRPCQTPETMCYRNGFFFTITVLIFFGDTRSFCAFYTILFFTILGGSRVFYDTFFFTFKQHLKFPQEMFLGYYFFFTIPVCTIFIFTNNNFYRYPKVS